MSTGVRRFSDEDEIMIAQEYRSGCTIAGLAKRRGCSPYLIRALLRRRGIERRPHTIEAQAHAQRKLTDEQEFELARSILAGEMMGHAARRLGVGRAVVDNALQRQGVTSPGWGNVPSHRIFSPEDTVRMVEMHGEGISLGGLAEFFRSHAKTIRSVLISNGVEVNYGQAKGARHGNWGGGRGRLGGYVRVALPDDDPMASMRMVDGYVLEHRLVMARHLGRPLTRRETVHHKSEDRADNRIENLQLRHGQHGIGQAFKCADCGSHNIVPVAI
jgi:hypothetical protein